MKINKKILDELESLLEAHLYKADYHENMAEEIQNEIVNYKKTGKLSSFGKGFFLEPTIKNKKPTYGRFEVKI